MNFYTIERLDRQQDNSLLRQAAALILQHVHHKWDTDYTVTEAAIDGYLGHLKPYTQHYALLAEGELLGAASLITAVTEDVSALPAITIRPERQGQGHGQALMHFMAEAVLAQGDTQIELCAMEPAFFARLGFAADGEADGPIMTADAADVLQRTEPVAARSPLRVSA